MTVSTDKKPDTNTTVRLPKDVHLRVRSASALIGETIQEFVSLAVALRLEHLAKEKKFDPNVQNMLMHLAGISGQKVEEYNEDHKEAAAKIPTRRRSAG